MPPELLMTSEYGAHTYHHTITVRLHVEVSISHFKHHTGKPGYSVVRRTEEHKVPHALQRLCRLWARSHDLSL